MGAQVVFEIDLEILGELSQESVLRAIRRFIDKKIRLSWESDLVDTAFRYFPQTITLTKLNARGIVAMSVPTEIRLNVFAVGSSSMISLPSMLCLLTCRGKAHAYRNAFLVSDH